MAVLNRVPKSCYLARTFGDNKKEAERQLRIWIKSPNIGVDSVVRLYHTKSRGWGILVCGYDYRLRRGLVRRR